MPWYGVCGYGCNPGGKRILEYIQFACEKAYYTPRTTALVLSGGPTEPAFYLTEAEMMRCVAVGLGYWKSVPLLKEVRSLTSIQNIRNMRDYDPALESRNNGCVCLEERPEGIICDKDRVRKVRFILSHIWRNDIPVFGFDFHRTAKEKALILAGTVKDVAAIHFPSIEEFFLEQRKCEIGLD